jgi:hypothetical protein
MSETSNPPPAPASVARADQIHWTDARVAAVVEAAYILQAVRR